MRLWSNQNIDSDWILDDTASGKREHKEERDQQMIHRAGASPRLRRPLNETYGNMKATTKNFWPSKLFYSDELASPGTPPIMGGNNDQSVKLLGQE